jgi:hypothetical protein
VVAPDDGRLAENGRIDHFLAQARAARDSRGFPVAARPANQPGSCPFALNTAPADGVVRNSIGAFAADESFEPTPTPAWKTLALHVLSLTGMPLMSSSIFARDSALVLLLVIEICISIQVPACTQCARTCTLEPVGLGMS